jgi:hypothetical protein
VCCRTAENMPLPSSKRSASAIMCLREGGSGSCQLASTASPLSVAGKVPAHMHEMSAASHEMCSVLVNPRAWHHTPHLLAGSTLQPMQHATGPMPNTHMLRCVHAAA